MENQIKFNLEEIRKGLPLVVTLSNILNDPNQMRNEHPSLDEISDLQYIN